MKKRANNSSFLVTNSLAITIVVFAGIIAIASMYAPDKTGETISVSGKSQLTVEPDQVGVYAQITTEEPTAKEAKDQNTLIANKIIQDLILQGIDKGDIDTENFHVYEQYDWFDGEKAEDSTYVASHTLKVLVSKDSDIGEVVDSVIDNGGLVSHINSELSFEKRNELKSQTLTSAASDARSKADAIAEGLGMRVGDLVSVTTNDYGYESPVVFAAREDMVLESDSINIDPRDVSLSAAVTVVFELV